MPMGVAANPGGTRGAPELALLCFPPGLRWGTRAAGLCERWGDE